jgi:hypothetical protein
MLPMMIFYAVLAWD